MDGVPGVTQVRPHCNREGVLRQLMDSAVSHTTERKFHLSDPSARPVWLLLVPLTL